MTPRPPIVRRPRLPAASVLVALVATLSVVLPPASAQTAHTTAPTAPTLDELLAAGRYVEAEALLQRLADGGSVRALLALARLESGRGRADAAADVLRRALDLAPNSEEVLSAFARVHLGAGRPAPALQALGALARMHPDVAEHAYLLGVARLQVGLVDDAVEPLHRAATLEPSDARHHAALGLALVELKQHDEAASALRRALALDPESVASRAALAEATEGLGALDDAERHARAALALAGPSTGGSGDRSSDRAIATAELVLGRLAMQRGEHEVARDAFLRALAREGDAAKIHYQLSLAHARLGDADASRAAREAYQRALRTSEERVANLRRAAPLGRQDPPDPEPVP